MTGKKFALAQIKQAEDALKTAKRNLKFHSLPKAEQRVAIAKDVLTALDARKIVATNQGYLNGDPTGDKSCRVCALGGVFVTGMRKGLFQPVEIEHFDDGEWSAIDEEGMREQLRPHFSSKQLSLIESAFEVAWFTDGDIELSQKELERAVAFGTRYACPNDRMRAIMKNIIQNKGAFKP